MYYSLVLQVLMWRRKRKTVTPPLPEKELRRPYPPLLPSPSTLTPLPFACSVGQQASLLQTTQRPSTRRPPPAARRSPTPSNMIREALSAPESMPYQGRSLHILEI